MTPKPPLVLASASPRRRAFLALFDISFSVDTADIDETPFPNESPTDLVQRLSLQKAQKVAQAHPPQAIIIAGDTIVVLDDDILGKPESPEEARHMLRRLRQRQHAVYSAVSLLRQDPAQQYTALSKTLVSMRPYTDAEIDRYVASGDPMDKAGAYAIQHPNFAPVAHIQGCYASVVGLPLKELGAGLTQFGLTLPYIAAQCSAFTGQPCCATL